MSEPNPRSPMSFKLRPEDRKRIVGEARAAGMTVGSYIRLRLLDAPQTKTVYRRNLTKRMMIKLVGQIGRVDNNMNQIAFKMTGDMMLVPLDRPLHEEGRQALKEMRAILITHMLQNGPC